MLSFVAHDPFANARPQGPLEQAVKNRRHRRVPLGTECSFTLPNGEERRGTLVDLSVRGAAVAADPAAIIGDVITIKAADIGTFQGRVVRVMKEGFSVILQGGKDARVRRADQLMMVLNQEASQTRAKRYPLGKQTILERASGDVAHCQILDVSETGASIGCLLKPELGERVRIGRKRALVVRHHEEGFAVSFTRSQPA